MKNGSSEPFFIAIFGYTRSPPINEKTVAQNKTTTAVQINGVSFAADAEGNTVSAKQAQELTNSAYLFQQQHAQQNTL